MFDKIIQVYSHFLINDGVSVNIGYISDVFDQNNIKNMLFTITIDKNCNFDKKKWANINKLKEAITKDTLIIFHYAMPTALSFLISELNCSKILLYHNITPPVFFNKYNPQNVSILSSGYREIHYMSSYFSYAWGVSEYNCSQLREAGYPRTAVVNPPYDFSIFSTAESFKKVRKKNGIKDILFVGRISPNKRQEDIIKAFYYYYKLNPNSELNLVGSYKNYDDYKNDLENLALKLKIPVKFTGEVSFNELAAYYKKADLFLCMSEHEGFCLPLIEAMYFGIPVIAFDSSAVPETIGNAGIIFKQKHFPSVAHLMNEVLQNASLLEKMKLAGYQRAEYYSKEQVSIRLIKLIRDYADELNINKSS